MSSPGIFGLLQPLTQPVGTVYGFLTKTRSREMIFEEAAGMGLLRTGMDFSRGYIYGADKPNWDMARERVIREVSSVFTDDVLSGWVAWAAGAALFFRKTGRNAASFMPYDHLEIFQDLAKQSTHRGQFYETLVEKIIRGLPSASPEARKLIQETFRPETIQPLLQYAQMPKVLDEHATKLAKTVLKGLGRKQFDIPLMGRQIGMDELIHDLALLEHQVGEGLAKKGKTLATEALPEVTGTLWNQEVGQFTKNISRFKNLRLLALISGFVASVSVAPFNVWLTRKLTKMDMYPGELYLRKADGSMRFQGSASGKMSSGDPVQAAGGQTHTALSPSLSFRASHPKGSQVSRPRFGYFEAFQNAHETLMNSLSSTFTDEASPANATESKPDSGVLQKPQSFWEKWTPYLHKSMKQGNLLPLILMSGWVVPTFFVDTVNKQLINPFAKGVFKKVFDFSRSNPFTTQQQMASIYGALIISRLMTARSPSEFRERFTDSSLGWGLWVLGTPMIKKWVAKRSDPELLKTVENGAKMTMLRTEKEMEHFYNGLKSTTGQKMMWIGALASLSTILLLGLVEPLISILVTRWQVRQEQEQQQQQQQEQEKKDKQQVSKSNDMKGGTTLLQSA